MNQELIEQYVAGRLSEAEAQAFEDYCLANPEFAKQVEYEQRLKAGLTQVARGSTAEFVRSNHPLRWSLAAAAGRLLVAIVLDLLRVESPRSRAHAPAHAWRRSRPTRSATAPHCAWRWFAAPRPRRRCSAASSASRSSDCSISAFHYSVALDRLEQNKKVDTVATLYSQHPTSPVTLEVMVDSDQLRPARIRFACTNRPRTRNPSISAS